MTGYTGVSYTGIFQSAKIRIGSVYSIPGSGTVASVTVYFMRGRDVDCGPVTYRTWTVLNTPDITGALYTGSKCGGSALTDIVVMSKWIQGS